MQRSFARSVGAFVVSVSHEIWFRMEIWSIRFQFVKNKFCWSHLYLSIFQHTVRNNRKLSLRLVLSTSSARVQHSQQTSDKRAFLQ